MSITIFYLQLYGTDYFCLDMMPCLLLLKVRQLPIFVFETLVKYTSIYTVTNVLMCRQVKWGNCGIPWVNCAVLWKTTGKDSSEACAVACQNCAIYSVFPSGVMPHSKIAQFNWECIAPLMLGSTSARLLGWRVWIPPGSWMSVSCVCCVGTGLCDGLITRSEETHWVCVSH